MSEGSHLAIAFLDEPGVLYADSVVEKIDFSIDVFGAEMEFCVCL